MTDVVMPQMGESIVEGTLTKWLKKVGDQVQRDEPLFEISTDKVDSEIPSPAAGVLTEVLVAEGSTVAINTVVARIGAAGAAPAAPAPAQAAAPPPPPAPAPVPAPVAAAPAAPPPPAPVAPPPAPAAPVSEEAGMLSPLVRRMARENNVDLAQVTGTGAGGRVTKQDVDAYLASRGAATPAAAAPPAPVAVTPPPAPAAAPAAAAPAPVAAAPPPPAGVVPPKTQVVPMTTMRAKIAEHMVFSKQTSSHVTTVHKVDMTKVAKLRDKIKGAFQERYGFSLTFLSFIARATSEALKTYPLVNASIEGKNIVYHTEVNIGIAVALDGGNGLIVPVIKNADEKNVVGLQRSIVDLANRARGKQLKPDEVQGGTFSITNFGSFG
ncbi:MAG: 2-oxo acid dehydrogenase subunit E2, partial [Bryobacterales bacterium]|nr:2-oxo acid dehydrogenase subunit E2 [Bryobacterales bacterium]